MPLELLPAHRVPMHLQRPALDGTRLHIESQHLYDHGGSVLLVEIDGFELEVVWDTHIQQ